MTNLVYLHSKEVLLLAFLEKSSHQLTDFIEARSDERDHSRGSS